MTSPEKKSGLLERLGDIAAEKILPKLVELLYPKLELYFETRLKPWLGGLVPLAAASAVHAVIDEIPGIDAVRSIGDTVEKVIDDVNVAVPDIDIKGVSDKFDLTEFINSALGRR
jgi:hypothetical protein